MNLTAREWIELIADPEEKEKVKGWVRDYPHMPEILVESIELALYSAINQNKMPTDNIRQEYYETRSNPPALLPIPNKEREAAEAVLNEYRIWNNGRFRTWPISENEIRAFLNQKYPTNG